MANRISIEIAGNADKAKAAFDQAKSGMAGVGASFEKHGKQIGLAMAGAGAGIEALARKQAPLNDATKKLAIQTGLTEKEIRGMATSLSNATFPLDSALALMQQGSKAGLEGADALKEYANFWDMVSDATGLSSEALAESGAALKAVGVEAGNEASVLSAFGLITQQTSGNVQDFLGFVQRAAPELNEMGIGVDQAAVILTAMERELGLTARTAKTEFTEAVSKAGSEAKEAAERLARLEASQAHMDESFKLGKITLASYTDQTDVMNVSIAREKTRLDNAQNGAAGLMATLGLSEEQIAKYTAMLGTSGDVIGEYAAAHATTKTRLEEFQSTLGDVLFSSGQYLEQAAQLAPVLLVLGPAVAALSAAKAAYAVVANIASIATTAFGIALKVALGPIGLVLLAITGLIAIGVLLYKNWDTVSAKAKEIWGAIVKFFETTWESLVGIFKNNWDKILLIIFPPVGLAMLVANNWGAIVNVVSGIWEKVKEVVKSAINDLIDKINAFIQRINSIRISIPRVHIPLDGTVGGGSVGFPSIPEIPTLQHGGRIRTPGLAVVGETGPELLRLPRGAAVTPLSGGAAMGGGPTLNITVVNEGTIIGIEDAREWVQRTILDALNAGGFPQLARALG